MGQIKSFLLGLGVGLAVLSCAAAPVLFPYKFYHLSGNGFEGKLLGSTPGEDLLFMNCKPEGKKQKCVVVFYTELNKLIADYKSSKQELIDCQRGH